MMNIKGKFSEQMAAVPAPIPIAVVNENSKYAGSVAVKKAGPPPARKMAGAIDVIGGGNLSSRRPESGTTLLYFLLLRQFKMRKLCR